eukprot:ctg_227.g121
MASRHHQRAGEQQQPPTDASVPRPSRFLSRRARQARTAGRATGAVMVTDFAAVLERARTSDVTLWKVADVRHALQWAQRADSASVPDASTPEAARNTVGTSRASHTDALLQAWLADNATLDARFVGVLLDAVSAEAAGPVPPSATTAARHSDLIRLLSRRLQRAAIDRQWQELHRVLHSPDDLLGS